MDKLIEIVYHRYHRKAT